MDNAVIHKHQSVLRTAERAKVNILFNVEYSPMLNPIERLFFTIKHRVKGEVANSYTK